MTNAPGPLAGLRVLDLSTLFAAPQLAALLGDLGAEVVKLEPPSGDPLREMGTRREGRSLVWAVTARNKRSITLDLARAEGRALLHRLLPRFDVVVENLPAATLERWALRYQDLAARNPRLVVVSVSCYGRTGPYRDRPGNGTLAEAFGGLTHLTGEADGPPLLTSLALGDLLAAAWGAFGALAACYQRDARGGTGQHVDVSMYEPILQLLVQAVPDYDQTGRVPRRAGNRIPGTAPRNLYRTRDGRWLALSAATDRLVERLLGLLGAATPEARARFGTAPARREHADELDALLADWVAERDAGAAQEALLAAGIPVAPVNDVAELLADPHVAARESVCAVADPVLGPLRMVAPVPRLLATPGSIRSTGPELGAHNAEIYGGWLGLGEGELEGLRTAGVI
jgi:succinyl-CoA--D-citramalate CoA-transferase